MAVPAKLLQIVAQLRKLRIIAGAEGGKGHLLIAGIVAGLPAVAHAQILTAVAHRAVHIPRLAESAATDAAAEQFQRHPVLHDLRGGHDGLGGIVGLVHVFHNALAHYLWGALLGHNLLHRSVLVVIHFIQAGHIQPRHLRRSAKEFPFTPSIFSGFTVQINEFYRHILALTQTDDVHKVGDRFRIIHSRTAGND